MAHPRPGQGIRRPTNREAKRHRVARPIPPIVAERGLPQSSGQPG